MSDIRIKQIVSYLDSVVERLDRGELSSDEAVAVEHFISEVEKINSTRYVRVTKNGNAILTSVSS